MIFILFVGLSPRVQQHNGSNTLPRSSHHSAVSESPIKHVSSFSQRSQNGSSIQGGSGSRRNSNASGIQTPSGNVTDTGTPSSTPSVPRRSSVGVDGSTKINFRGNESIENQINY